MALSLNSPLAKSTGIEHVDFAIADDPIVNITKNNNHCLIHFIKAPNMPIGLQLGGLNVEPDHLLRFLLLHEARSDISLWDTGLLSS